MVSHHVEEVYSTFGFIQLRLLNLIFDFQNNFYLFQLCLFSRSLGEYIIKTSNDINARDGRRKFIFECYIVFLILRDYPLQDSNRKIEC